MGSIVNGTYEPAIGETGWGALVNADLTHVGNAIDLWDNLSAAGYDPASGTDSAAGLQAVIDAVPTTGSAGVPAHTIYVPGHFRLDSQVNIYQKAIRFAGRGVGNPTNFSTPGEGSGFRWAGAAAGTMFNVRDSKWVSFDDLLLQGNKTTTPANIIYFENAGGSIGTNEQLFVSRCQIGGFAWTTPDTASGTTATAGIRFGGTNGNNDQFHFRDVVFERCATGLALDNSQSIWGQLTNVCFNTCSTAGVATSASMHYTNITFNACGIDWLLNSTAHVQGEGYYSENASQWVRLTGEGFFGASGGLLTNNASIAGTNGIDHQSCGDAGGLYLGGVFFNQAGLTHPKVKVRGTNGAPRTGSVTIIDCPGLASTDFDIANVISGANIYVFIASRESFTHQVLGPSGDVLSDPTVFAAEFSVDDLTVNDALHVGTDITLANPATDILAMGEAFYIQRSTGAVAYLAYVTGDTAGRWYVDVNGKHFLGSGAGATDVTVERSAANTLALGSDDTLMTGRANHVSLPSAASFAAGAQYYCRTDKKPLWSDGANWFEANGSAH